MMACCEPECSTVRRRCSRLKCMPDTCAMPDKAVLISASYVGQSMFWIEKDEPVPAGTAGAFALVAGAALAQLDEQHWGVVEVIRGTPVACIVPLHTL